MCIRDSTDPDGHVLVCYGDTPLMRAETYRSLIDLHLREGNACTLLSSHLEEGGNYGRVIRGADGSFSQVVEAKDCTPEQAAVAEVNVGVYVFRVRELLAALDQLTTDNAPVSYTHLDVYKRQSLCRRCGFSSSWWSSSNWRATLSTPGW